MHAPKDLCKAKQDIQCARDWANDHFNTNGPDTLLDPPAFDIDFTDADKMIVYPRFMGERLSVGISYQLKWFINALFWEGTKIITGEKFLLRVR